MKLCPKCGESLEHDDNGFVTPAILRGLMRKVGGPEKVGERLGEDWSDAPKGSHQRAVMNNTVRGYVNDADKLSAGNNIRTSAQKGELDSILMECTLRRIREDSDFAERFGRALTRKSYVERLGLPDPSVVEGEVVEA